MQYEETLSSIPIALRLRFFSLCSGRDWLRRNLSKPLSVKHMVSQPFSAFLCSETKGISVTCGASASQELQPPAKVPSINEWTGESGDSRTFCGQGWSCYSFLVASPCCPPSPLDSSMPGVLQMEMLLFVLRKNSLYCSSFTLVMYFRNVLNWLTAVTDFSYLVIKVVRWNSDICPEMHVSLNKSKLNKKLLKCQCSWSITGLPLCFVDLPGPDTMCIFTNQEI